MAKWQSAEEKEELVCGQDMKSITVKRVPGYYAKLRTLEIFVDSQRVGQLKTGEEMSLDIPADARVLEGRMDWGKTEPVFLQEVSNGQTVTFKGYCTFNLFRNLAVSPMPFKITVA